MNIPLTKIDILDEDIQCAADVLKSGWIMQGPRASVQFNGEGGGKLCLRPPAKSLAIMKLPNCVRLSTYIIFDYTICA